MRKRQELVVLDGSFPRTKSEETAFDFRCDTGFNIMKQSDLVAQAMGYSQLTVDIGVCNQGLVGRA